MGQGISTTQWYVYGKRHFTQTGYLRHIKDYKSPVQSRADIIRGASGADGVDLGGQVVVVTGANSGLGKEVATYAAAKGANVYMICRSKVRGEAARDEIQKATANENVNVVLADVGELNQVREAVKDLQSKESQIDCVVCNAGVLLNEKEVTSEGNEVTIAAHLMGGSYLLTKLLMPQLETAASNGKEPKVIYVTSGGMLLSKMPSWDVATNTADGQKYDGVQAYQYAKRGQVLLSEEFSKEKNGITFISGHPGWAQTPALDDAFGSSKSMFSPLRTPWTGAEGIAWLMGAKRAQLENGAFYLDRVVQQKHIAGPFMTEGKFTKNTQQEVDTFMENLKQACGI
eukprot:CAMPEP_0204626420 /NCGR_PEP_ID=MMETSP0717-20131115/12139_1 /ASSEMBLY_ACC=CAM_ASM_000666 /TAXON_ID=230516 /ORGANISM="Chaetoceros curvisetus" /LENGTH=342 /DNA_ID=CAMNT_0051642365 /DNA_START=96 /DNA_END=1124 /DNA_ORIENTATION=-